MLSKHNILSFISQSDVLSVLQGRKTDDAPKVNRLMGAVHSFIKLDIFD